MKQKIKVIVLLATFNGQNWIESQLRSILNQNKVEVEIVISDDNSSDKTLEIISKFIKTHSNITLIKNTASNGSFCSNFLNLISKANVNKYKYVAFSDQDDLWRRNKLINSVNKINEYNASGYSSSVIAFWLNGQNKIINQSFNHTNADFLFEGGGQGCTFTLPIKTFKKIQNFCIKHNSEIVNFYYHDWLIYLLVRSWNGNWFFDQTPQLYYRQHPSNAIGSRGTFLSFIKRFAKIRNGWYKKQISIALRIYFLASNKKNNLIYKFSEIFNKKDSVRRRFMVAFFVWSHGRRRLADRLILVLSSLLGYI